MTTAAIYARYSTNLQNETSIEDQVAICRQYAAREGLRVTRVFTDSALSGASLVNRPGARDMVAAAQAGEFSAIICFDLYRLSRDMEDLAGIYKRLVHAGVSLRAVHEGTVNTVLVGLRGLIGQLYREDNANNIRRAGAGRVKRGLAGGGLTYGYAAVRGERGKRVIVEAEAEIIRRIFAEYVDGATPRGIAAGLNKDRVPAPRGKLWQASTINGLAKRGAGILNNELYAGRIVWNRSRMIKDPDSGKRISRPNPPDQWVVKDAPELAIISAETFAAVQARRQARSKTQPTFQRRPRHVLSGLLRCAACGGGMSISGKDASGRTRLYCTTHKESSSCPNPQTFYLDTIENVVLDALRAEFRKPVVISEYVKTYHEERRKLATKANARQSAIKRRLAENDREHKRIIALMIKSDGDVTELGQTSKQLGRERDQLKAELAALPPAPTPTLELHPAVLARYEKQLDALQAVTAKGTARGDIGAAEALRDLIESVTVRRSTKRGGVAVEIKGRLDALLGPEKQRAGNVRGVWGSVVAGEGFEPPTHGL